MVVDQLQAVDQGHQLGAIVGAGHHTHRLVWATSASEAPAKRAISALRTADHVPASAGPIAPLITSLASKAATASVRLLGSLVMPAASRAASSRLAGSTPASAGRRRPRVTPSRPAAITAPATRYGLELASKTLISRLEPAPCV